MVPGTMVLSTTVNIGASVLAQVVLLVTVSLYLPALRPVRLSVLERVTVLSTAVPTAPRSFSHLYVLTESAGVTYSTLKRVCVPKLVILVDTVKGSAVLLAVRVMILPELDTATKGPEPMAAVILAVRLSSVVLEAVAV